MDAKAECAPKSEDNLFEDLSDVQEESEDEDASQFDILPHPNEDEFTKKDFESPKNSEKVTHPISSTIRIKRDMMSLCSDPPPGIIAVPDEENLTIIHALIVGPAGTPYEGGQFYFVLRCPTDYPFSPPKVRLMTTDASRVRFNPNLYKSGKVCLSILGTWEGPKWSAAQNLTTCLISIQSILNEKPYHNEPGFEKEVIPGNSDRYNEMIRHETLRVAVCGMLENETMLNIPEKLRDYMLVNFLEYYDSFLLTAKKKLEMDGHEFQVSSVASSRTPLAASQCRQPGDILCSLDCTQILLCVTDAEGELASLPVETCSADRFCYRPVQACIEANACDTTTRPEFECTKATAFPDPYDCTVYHVCYQLPDLTFEGVEETCDEGYAFDAFRKVCSLKVDDDPRVCLESPVPDCLAPGQSGGLVENPSMYYLCKVGTFLYPVLFECRNGEIYDNLLETCEPEVAASGKTDGTVWH